MAKEKRENVRVSSKTLGKVKRYIKKTKQYNIGNFYDVAVEEKLEVLSKWEAIPVEQLK